MCIQNFLIHVLHNDQSVVFSFLECHHPRSSLPLWCMLSAAVSAGGAVHPGAHGSRYEAWLLQEAQQRGTESLPQPARQRGRGQGAAAGGQQRITSAQGGQTPSLHLKMPCTHGQIHIIYHKDTHTHLRHTSHSSAAKRCLSVLLSTAHKVGCSFLSSPFLSNSWVIVRTF